MMYPLKSWQRRELVEWFFIHQQIPYGLQKDISIIEIIAPQHYDS